jgi:hypothetical protein
MRVRDLKPGDRVRGPFRTRTVEHVEVQDVSVVFDDDAWLRHQGPLGATVWWTDGKRTGYRLDADVDLEEP